MCNLLDHQFVIALAFFTMPKHPARVPFHIIDIGLCPIVLILRVSEGEAGFYLL